MRVKTREMTPQERDAMYEVFDRQRAREDEIKRIAYQPCPPKGYSPIDELRRSFEQAQRELEELGIVATLAGYRMKFDQQPKM